MTHPIDVRHSSGPGLGAPPCPPIAEAPGQERRFHFTGSVLETSFYVERPADQELPEALLAGHYRHILAPRQMGKSSLRARTVRELRRRGAHCASVDLTSVGTTSSAEEWYFGLIEEIAEKLSLEDPLDFWERHGNIAPARRFSEYLRWVLKARIPEGPVVVFFDEIEAVRLVSFNIDDFFLILRSLYEDRSQEPDLLRLGFCLMGVTTPNDLIKNNLVTPFNVSEPIQLDDFTRAEMNVLAVGLAHTGGVTERLLDGVHAWTDGHPYMTMRVCAALAQRGPIVPGTEAVSVDKVVLAELLERPLEDPNLSYAARRFGDPTYERGDARLGDKLLVYRRLLEGESIAADNESAIQMELRLCGMVKYTDSHHRRVVCLRNAIFSMALDIAWLRTKGDRRFITEAVWKWLDTQRNPGALLRGVVLEHALEWAKTSSLSEDEHAFLDASRRREAEELEQQRLQAHADLAALQAETHRLEREKNLTERKLVQMKSGQKSWNRAMAMVMTLAGVGLCLIMGVARDQVTTMDRANQELRAEKAALSVDTAVLNADKTALEKENEKLARHTTEVVKTLEEQIKSIADELRSRTKSAEAEQAALRRTYTKLQIQNNQLRGTKTKLEVALEDSSAKLKATVAALDKATNDLEEARQRFNLPFDDSHLLKQSTPQN